MAKKEKKCICPPPGAPGWMTTFADLMSLLMCFFVLLLSFSEIDVLKFKELSGSLKYAFGVQHQIEVLDIPKGTSIIALEFSPSIPKDTLLNVIQQETIDVTQNSLDFIDGPDNSSGGEKIKGGRLYRAASKSDESTLEVANDIENQDNQENYVYFNRLETELHEQVEDGSVQLESKGQEIIITVEEQSLFASGSGRLQPQFIPLMQKIAKSTNSIPGSIKITGHTDSSKMSNEIFSSNWELSSRRALAVANVMFETEGFDSTRVIVQSAGANMPKYPNDSPANRKKNRRVEITIKQGSEVLAPSMSVNKDAEKSSQKDSVIINEIE